MIYKQKQGEDENDVFDWIIGWSNIYPPADTPETKAAYKDAPKIVRDCFDMHGIDLTAVFYGEWSIVLHDDWWVNFRWCIQQKGGTPDEATEDAARDLANAIEDATNTELRKWMKKHGVPKVEWLT